MDVMSSLRRRWKLAGALLLMTIVITGLAWKKLPPTYQASSSIVLLAAKSTAQAFGGNPYLAFSSTLNQTADVVRYETNDMRTAESLKEAGYTSSYLVTDALDTSGPVLIVTVTGHSPVQVEHTLYGVTSQVNDKLAGLQAGLKASYKVRDAVITFTPHASVLKSKKLKPLALLVALCVVLTISIPVIVDARSFRRAYRNQAGDRTHPGRPRAPGRSHSGRYPSDRPSEQAPAVRQPARPEPTARPPVLGEPQVIREPPTGQSTTGRPANATRSAGDRTR